VIALEQLNVRKGPNRERREQDGDGVRSLQPQQRLGTMVAGAVAAFVAWALLARRSVTLPLALIVAVSTLLAYGGRLTAVLTGAHARLFYLGLIFPVLWSFGFDAAGLNEDGPARSRKVLMATGLAAAGFALLGLKISTGAVAPDSAKGAESGSMLVVLNGANYTVFAGPGGTVTIQFAGSIRLTPNGNGTYLIEDQGNTGLNTSVGEGPIAGSAGRTVLIGTFNPATLGVTTIELISQTGILSEPQLAAMCPTLRGD
jgi:hypothetical protein